MYFILRSIHELVFHNGMLVNSVFLLTSYKEKYKYFEFLFQFSIAKHVNSLPIEHVLLIKPSGHYLYSKREMQRKFLNSEFNIVSSFLIIKNNVSPNYFL